MEMLAKHRTVHLNTSYLEDRNETPQECLLSLQQTARKV
jgi:hypothetical protein